MLGLSGTRSVVASAALAVWSLFAWALNPPMQASVLAAAPHAGMTAMALNISALTSALVSAGCSVGRSSTSPMNASSATTLTVF
jgi:hypothetical protein